MERNEEFTPETGMGDVGGTEGGFGAESREGGTDFGEQAEQLGSEAGERARDLGSETRERAEKLGSEVSRHAREIGTEARRHAGELGSEARRHAREFGSEARRVAEDQLESVQHDVSRITDDLSERIREHPLISVGAALTAGYLIGRIFGD